jgi:hypothetical protein
MERNTVAPIKDLQAGDRFYIQNDRKKEVRVKVERPVKKTHYRAYHYWSVLAAVYDNNADRLQHLHEMHFKPHSGDTACVFLRHGELSTAKLPNE